MRYPVSLFFFYPEKRNTWKVKQFLATINSEGIENHKRKVIEVQKKESDYLHRNDGCYATGQIIRLKVIDEFR